MSKNIRTFLLTGHGGCGKTTLCEAILFKAGVTTRLGMPDQGTSILDYDPEEIERKISINLSFVSFEQEGVLYQLIDTPGFLDFQGELKAGLKVADGVVLVIDAGSGVEVGTELFGQMVFDAKLPVIVFINKVKTENANPDGIIEQLKSAFEGKSFFKLQFPIGKGSSFSEVKGLFDENLPEELSSEKESAMESIIEVSEDLVERYLEGKKIPQDELKETLKKGVISGEVVPVLFGDAVYGIGIVELIGAVKDYFPSPVERTYTAKNENDENVELKLESSKPLVAFVFKTVSEPHLGEVYYLRVLQGVLKPGTEVLNTTKGHREKINQIFLIKGRERLEISELKPGQIGAIAKLKNTGTSDTLCSPNSKFSIEKIEFPEPLISTAIVPKSKQDEEKVMEAMSKLSTEDPTFKFHYNPELKQRIAEGLGEVHLDVIISKMKQRYGVEVLTEKPRIPYRESIRKRAEAMGKYVKQTGGRGQYGICYIRIEPKERGEGYEFVNDIFGGAIPSNFIPSVETGIKKAMESGVVGGYPVVDVKVTLYDGKYHPVDSSNIAFEIAGSMAFKESQQKADPYLLEPIYDVEVTVPEDVMGDTIGDLNARRGKVLGMESSGRRKQKIKAKVPLADMYKYSNTLRSLTKGKGIFSMSFSHYEEVPPDVAHRVIQSRQRRDKKGEG